MFLTTVRYFITNVVPRPGVLTKSTVPRAAAACRGVPQAQVKDWGDISRLDVRPSRGLIKVTAKNNWEIQVDAGTGQVLQAAYRRSDLIEALHDGSGFHEAAKLWVFLPAGATLLVLWLTGIYLFWLPIGVRRRKRLTLKAAGVPERPR